MNRLAIHVSSPPPCFQSSLLRGVMLPPLANIPTVAVAEGERWTALPSCRTPLDRGILVRIAASSFGSRHPRSDHAIPVRITAPPFGSRHSYSDHDIPVRIAAPLFGSQHPVRIAASPFGSRHPYSDHGTPVRIAASLFGSQHPCSDCGIPLRSLHRPFEGQASIPRQPIKKAAAMPGRHGCSSRLQS